MTRPPLNPMPSSRHAAPRPLRRGTTAVRLALVGMLALLASACSDPAPSLLVTVQDPLTLAPTQLRVTVTNATGDTSVVTRPDVPGEPLSPNQTIRVLLSHAAVGSSVSLAVEGLRAVENQREPQVMALASGTFLIDVSRELPAVVSLNQPECLDDGDCTARTCFQAGVCVLGFCERAPESQGSPCANADACVVNEVCDGQGTCSGGSPRLCQQIYGACTTSVCDPAQGCVDVAVEDGTVCDDLNACTNGDHCTGGTCIAGPFPCQGAEACCTNGAGYSCVTVPTPGMTCTATQ